MAEEFVSQEVASEITGLTVAALAQLRYKGTGPKFYKPTARSVRYRRSEVIAWVESHAQNRTGQTALAG